MVKSENRSRTVQKYYWVKAFSQTKSEQKSAAATQSMDITDLEIFSVHLFFYKQPVYKQLAPGWQIAKQLPGYNPLSLSNNKKCRLKKSGVWPLQ